MLKHIGANLLIAGLILLCLLWCLLAALEWIPTAPSGLEVQEEVTVSASLLNKNDQTYVLDLYGSLFNPTDEAVNIQSLKVTVSDGDGQEETLTLEGMQLPPRTKWEIGHRWEGVVNYDRVTHVVVVTEGGEDLIPNTESAVKGSGLALIYLALLLMTAGILIRRCKLRYYMHQEDRMAEGK
ncbi:MAG: hypothetical protein IJX28_02450 [Clostridia bacterium]|nr:hypothetical protein [Clostridia bacterium]